ncbi:MAG: 30S ribosomal protein S4 [bacterium]|nr:30S ribosomal protein S4 [bacterium]
MARYRGSVCRLCRRQGSKLFLKGDRCLSSKCALSKRNYAPGLKGQDRRGKVSEYGIQLREKQKIKRTYGVLEQPFRNYFYKAERQSGMTGTNLILLLERRLDNVLYRLGWAASRPQARQLVGHGHFLVNGKKVDIPSFLVKPEDEIGVYPRDRSKKLIKKLAAGNAQKGISPWLEVNQENLTGRFVRIPEREEIGLDANESLVVELYSK